MYAEYIQAEFWDRRIMRISGETDRKEKRIQIIATNYGGGKWDRIQKIRRIFNIRVIYMTSTGAMN